EIDVSMSENLGKIGATMNTEIKQRDFMSTRYNTFFYLSAGLLFIFVARTLLAVRFPMPRLTDIFTVLTVAGSLVILFTRFDQLKASDWIVGVGTGLLVGVTMYYATLFTPYDFLGIVQGNVAQALTRGVCTFVAMMGGLAIMRQGGCVQVRLAHGDIR